MARSVSSVFAVAIDIAMESSDDEDILIKILQTVETYRKDVPKIKNYVEEVVHKYSDKQFQKHFRVSRETMNKLIKLFHESIYFPKNIAGRRPVSGERQMLAFVSFAANKTVYCKVAEKFNFSLSSFDRIFKRVSEFLLSIGPKIIKFPTTDDEKRDLASDFEKISGFPNVLGCIDGSYIPIRTPAKKIRSTYVNRHQQTSTTLQGICDSRKRFLDVFTGVSGKSHDSRVYQLSFIKEQIPSICEGPSRWGYHILGDAAYPLTKCLLTAYREHQCVSEHEIQFNKKFNATRVLIENAFGLLKGRFRQLVVLDFKTMHRSAIFITCCCILHNFCIDNNDPTHIDMIFDTDNISNNCNIANVQNAEDRQLGKMKRGITLGI